MKTAQKVIRTAKALAKIMTRSQDVKVTISGRTAYRTPGRINVPFGDFSNPDIVAMTHGYIDHELGHEENTNHSDFVAFAVKSPFHKHVLNIIEDVRMEGVVGDTYPGAKRNLETLARLAIKNELFQEPTSDASAIHLVQALCLYRGRAHVLQQSCLTDYAKKAKELLNASLGNELVDKITALVDSTEHANTTRDAVEIAESIVELLEQEVDNENDNSEDGSDDSSNGSGDADSDSSDSSDSNDSDEEGDKDNENGDQTSDSESDSPDSDDSKGDKSKSEEGSDSNESEENSSDDSQSDSAQSDDKSTSNQSQPSSDSGGELGGDIERLIREILESSEEDGLKDFHEAVAETLEEQAEDNPLAEIGEVDMSPLPIEKSCQCGTAFGQSEAKAAGKRVFNALNRVLIDEVNSNPIHRNRGKKINPRRLSGIPVGQDRIFRRFNNQQDTSAAISFIVDASGSMNQIMSEVNACAFAFASGLQAPGIVTETLYFAALGAQDGAYIAKSFSEKPLAKRFSVSCWGGTPTGEAMLTALSRLSVREETNKMMFVITDGMSNNSAAVQQSRRMAEMMGVRVIPIGIDTGFIHGFRQDEFKSIQSVSELAGAVKHAVREKLFVKAA